jgi:alkanesulfonate monooxygenase SsuD/methylene tetrahydromethanopterin reductase-like flavin-dependent oxidoreductase (luciferase family)
MLEEAIEPMRALWQGGFQSFDGAYYHVEDTWLYTLPENPVEVMVAASGQRAAALAGGSGDGLIGTAADASLVEAFESAGGAGRDKEPSDDALPDLVR